MIKIPCVILCGGKSSRMGENKALLPFGDEKTLIEFQYKRLKEIFSNVYVNAKNRELFDYEFIEDRYSNIFSPANALYSIITKLNTPFFAISVDTPFVDKKTIEKIINTDISTIASSNGKRHPLCAFYTKDILKPLETMLSRDIHKIGILLEQVPHKIVEFEDDDIFFNLNNKDEYEKAKELIKKYKK